MHAQLWHLSNRMRSSYYSTPFFACACARSSKNGEWTRVELSTSQPRQIVPQHICAPTPTNAMRARIHQTEGMHKQKPSMTRLAPQTVVGVDVGMLRRNQRALTQADVKQIKVMQTAIRTHTRIRSEAPRSVSRYKQNTSSFRDVP